MKTQIKKKSVTRPTKQNKSAVKAKVKLKSKTKPKVKPKLSSTAYLKHVKNLKIRLSIEPKMTLHQKNRLKLASTKNLQKFTSLCKLTEISTAMNAQVVEAVGSSISKNQGFKIDVINSKFNLKTNSYQLSLKFNAKKKSQFTTLVGKIFGKKLKILANFFMRWTHQFFLLDSLNI